MDGRIYTYEFENQTITTAGGDRDLFYFAPADDKPIWLIGWDFAQFSDLQDAGEEVLRIRVIRGHATVGSGGTAVTASTVFRKNGGDPDPSLTARVNDTTIASAGTAFNAYSGGYNIRTAPCPLILPESLWIPCSQTQTSLVIRLMGAPTDDVLMSATAWILEGG